MTYICVWEYDRLLFYLLGGNAACQIVVYDGNRIFGEVNIKLYVGSALQVHY